MPNETFYTRTKTATADTPFQLDDDDKIYLSSINIACYTNACKYGDRARQDATIQPNAVVWFDKPVRVSDLWFKNYTAGSNCVITITGTLAR